MMYSVNGVELAVESVGTGSTALVFLHYFAGSSQVWNRVIPQVEGAYRCIALDLRGFGHSEHTDRGYTLEEGADDIAALVAMLGLQDFVLVGHSMGGKIAMAFAARQPVGLRGLVLVAPSPPTPEPMTDADRGRLLDGYGQREQAETTVEGIVAQPLSSEMKDALIADNLRTSHAAWNAWLEEGSREDISDAVAHINVPVVVVVGEEDQTIPLDVQQREVVARLSHAQLYTAQHAAHLLPLEAPDVVVAAIRQVGGHQ